LNNYHNNIIIIDRTCKISYVVHAKNLMVYVSMQ